MMFGTRTLLATTALMLAMATSAHSKPMNYVGKWSNTAKYSVGQVVQYNGALFYALQSTRSAPNVNLIPSSNPTWWAPVGTIGNTLLHGVGNPTSPNLGQVGDFYINTETNTIFGPKTAIAPFWPASGTSLIGSEGQVGPQGEPGATGPAGAVGPQGPAGIAGAAGPQGAIGPTGPRGDTGPAGPTPPPTVTVSVDCSSGGSIKEVIDGIVGGTVATINVTGACNENIIVPAGKTIVIAAATSSASITAENTSLPALISRGDTTLRGMSISNPSGAAEALVETDQGDALEIVASDLSAPNVESVVGAWLGTTRISNSRVVGGVYSAVDTFGSSTLRVKGDPTLPVGPTDRFETLLRSSGSGIGCSQGGVVRIKADKSGSAIGYVTVEPGQSGLYGERCDLEIIDSTETDSSVQFRDSNGDGIYMKQSRIKIYAAVISNSTNNGIFLEDSSIHLTKATISHSGACGLNLQRSTGRLAQSTITSSGETQAYGVGVCAGGGDLEISGGMVLSNNVVGDVRSGLGGAIVFQSWDGPSSLPDFAIGDSLGCWAGGHMYVMPGSTIQDLTSNYASDPCISFE